MLIMTHSLCTMNGEMLPQPNFPSMSFEENSQLPKIIAKWLTLRQEMDLPWQGGLHHNLKTIGWNGLVLICVSANRQTKPLLTGLPTTYDDFGNSTQTTDYFVHDRDGRVKLVKCLTSDILKIHDERLHLSAVVKEIERSDRCVCATATENGKKNHTVHLLQSSLSVWVSCNLKLKTKSKMDLINRLDVAHHLYIFVEFNQVFWDTNVEYIGHVNSLRGYFPLFIVFQNDTPLLQVAVTGENANRIVNQTEEKTKYDITQVLQNIYNLTIPEPRHYQHHHS